MPKIIPFDPTVEILEESGLVPDEIAENQIQKLCRDKGCSVEEALEQLSFLMKRSEVDNVRLRAAESVLKINGIYKDEETKAKHPTVNITIIGNESKSLINLVMPNQEG